MLIAFLKITKGAVWSFGCTKSMQSRKRNILRFNYMKNSKVLTETSPLQPPCYSQSYSHIASEFLFQTMSFLGAQDSEFLKAGILGSRIPDIFWEESGHFKVHMYFLDYSSAKFMISYGVVVQSPKTICITHQNRFKCTQMKFSH